jgi:membrane fusion protein, peptide pheromone/bacteriocin exporter
MRCPEDDSFAEFAKNGRSYHYYFGEISVSGRLIYISVIIFICGVIISLPFIKVEISVRAKGIIRPVCEKTEITSLIPGRIEKIFYREGTSVEKGQILITLERKQIFDEIQYYKYENLLLSNEIADLNNLLADKDSTMVSVKYQLELTSYKNHLCKVQEQLDKARKEKERFDALFREKLISDKEYDDLIYAQSQLEKEIEYMVSTTMNGWQIELSRLRYQIGQTRTAISRIENELRQCEILAPLSGRIDPLSGIYEGSIIQSGQPLATITPDTFLIGEIYITPKDIGLIKSNQEIIMIIDAFDYREWGVVRGCITDIPEDFILINNQPLFRIKCVPKQNYLQLKNGFEGRLKKGMTFQARCLVTTQSLSHLIIGKLDQWLNPALNN